MEQPINHEQLAYSHLDNATVAIEFATYHATAAWGADDPRTKLIARRMAALLRDKDTLFSPTPI